MKRKPIAISIVLAGFLFLLSAAVSADTLIARFVFVTEPQTIQQGKSSGGLTIQAQDDQGNSRNTDETIDLAFSSTSPTGEFLSAAGEPAKTVMNKGTANRTFYYRDASSGRHTLAVRATGRVSGKSWTTSQYIIVGADSVSSEAGKSSSSSVSLAASSTSDSFRAPVTPRPPVPAIEAYAGDDRTVPVGVETEFVGNAVGLMREPIANARFWWNFGDGETREGKSVGHVFRALGAYIVVLSVSSGDYAATDYARVSVVPNQIAIADVVAGGEGHVRLENGSETPVDIGGWILEDDRARQFTVPVRTVIGARAAAAFANRITMLAPETRVVLRSPDGALAVSWSAPSASGRFAGESAHGPPSPPPAVPLRTHALSEFNPVSPAVSAEKKEKPSVVPSPAVSSDTAAAGSAVVRHGFLSPTMLFGAAFMISIGGAIGFFCLRRMIS